MIDAVIQQTLIEHNEQWRERNAALLAQAKEEDQRGATWDAIVTRTLYSASEEKRLRLWESTKVEYGIEEQPA